MHPRYRGLQRTISASAFQGSRRPGLLAHRVHPSCTSRTFSKSFPPPPARHLEPTQVNARSRHWMTQMWSSASQLLGAPVDFSCSRSARYFAHSCRSMKLATAAFAGDASLESTRTRQMRSTWVRSANPVPILPLPEAVKCVQYDFCLTHLVSLRGDLGNGGQLRLCACQLLPTRETSVSPARSRRHVEGGARGYLITGPKQAATLAGQRRGPLHPQTQPGTVPQLADARAPPCTGRIPAGAAASLNVLKVNAAAGSHTLAGGAPPSDRKRISEATVCRSFFEAATSAFCQQAAFHVAGTSQKRG